MADIDHITINIRGAELASIAAGGKELLWQGDSTFWSRRAPILFPIVGRVADDKLLISGSNYMMKQHGFARDAQFEARGCTGDSILLQPNDMPVELHMMQDGLSANYPYHYDLVARYVIDGNRVTCTWVVCNLGTEAMHFQIGAHPAFLLPEYDCADAVHGYVQFYDAQGDVVRPILHHYLVNGLRRRLNTPKPLLEEGQFALPLTDTTFEGDAFLLERGQVASTALLDKHGRKVLTVSCSQAESFGIWAPAKPGCPFVCLEPWCGIADREGSCGDIAQRECDHFLDPGEGFRFEYTIEVE